MELTLEVFSSPKPHGWRLKICCSSTRVVVAQQSANHIWLTNVAKCIHLIFSLGLVTGAGEVLVGVGGNGLEACLLGRDEAFKHGQGRKEQLPVGGTGRSKGFEWQY